MRKVIAIIALAFALGACSTTVSNEDLGGDQCSQVRHKKFLFITYSNKENLVACDSEE